MTISAIAFKLSLEITLYVELFFFWPFLWTAGIEEQQFDHERKGYLQIGRVNLGIGCLSRLDLSTMSAIEQSSLADRRFQLSNMIAPPRVF